MLAQFMKEFSRFLLGIVFILAGINHFLHASLYVRIMPPYLPWPTFLVYLSGLCEIALGAGMLIPSATRPSAWGLIALLVAVFPANLHMAFHADKFAEFNPALLWWRLPLQAVLIVWVAWHTR